MATKSDWILIGLHETFSCYFTLFYQKNELYVNKKLYNICTQYHLDISI